MDSARSSIPEKLYTLKQTADILAVTIDTLLEWNDNNILKPTIAADGKVVYSQEQINKFLEIQRISLNKNTVGEGKGPINKSQVSPIKPINDEPLNTYNLTNIATLTQTTKLSTATKNPKTTNDSGFQNIYSPRGTQLRTFGFAISFFIIAISLTATLITYQSRIRTQPQQNFISTEVEKVSKNNLGGIEVSNSNTPATDKNSGITTTDNKFTALHSAFNNAKASSSSNTKDSNIATTVLGLNRINSTQTDVDQNAINIDGGTINNRASRPSTKDAEETVFDKDGNIKGETIATNLFPSTLGFTGTIQSNGGQKRSSSQNVILTFLILGTLTIVFVVGKQSIYMAFSNSTSDIYPISKNDVEKQKILEIDQKTDGTVVLYFMGEEHKVSKPELNSETDRFIERLMGLTKDNVKKVQYDILKDEKIKLDAPLSKLVTRLGFVGIKRDLFFPRTSKNKILFRKYITRQDLNSMGLTENQISEVLSK